MKNAVIGLLTSWVILSTGCTGHPPGKTSLRGTANEVGASERRTSRDGRKTEENKQVLLRVHREVWSKGDLEAVDGVYDKDCICHFNWGSEYRGIKEVKARVAGIHAIYPDWCETVEEIMAEGDLVATRWRSTGTHNGADDASLAGKKVAISEMGVFRVRGGRIVEQWALWDYEDLKNQLKK